MRKILAVVALVVLTGCAGGRGAVTDAMVEHQAELASTIIYILNEDFDQACIEAKPLILATVEEYLELACAEQDALRHGASGE